MQAIEEEAKKVEEEEAEPSEVAQPEQPAEKVDMPMPEVSEATTKAHGFIQPANKDEQIEEIEEEKSETKQD